MKKPDAQQELPVTTKQLIEELKERLAVESDYALAGILGVTRSQMSRYKHGHDQFSDDMAIRVAELLGRSPAYVMACSHAERAKSAGAKVAWGILAGLAAMYDGTKKHGGKAAAVILGVMLGTLLAPHSVTEWSAVALAAAPVDAQMLCIMLSASLISWALFRFVFSHSRRPALVP